MRDPTDGAAERYLAAADFQLSWSCGCLISKPPVELVAATSSTIAPARSLDVPVLPVRALVL